MSHNYAERHHRYVEDEPHLKVYPLNCVPSYRPKGSWTNGVKAYEKSKGSEGARCVGWFFPPRIRNKGHHSRKGPKPRRAIPIIEEEE